jgi:hypothetical protein
MRSMLRRLMLPATALLLFATDSLYPDCARFTVIRRLGLDDDRVRIYGFSGGKRG